MQIPNDYLERVYAGVLGKLIGVYLGRPFEGWTYQRIMDELGPIEYFVHERLNQPLVVTDDDVAGTFTFIRALEDYGISPDLSAEEIGKAWLNYIVEERSILWWGGNGNSTEHTAWLNLKRGVAAPASGSIETNGSTVAEQIGAQIFIDGWAMVAPRQPELAARLAEQAGKVSHDGESVYAAMLWAAMEAEAFGSSDIDHLLDTGLKQIPRDSLIAKLIADIRAWHKSQPGLARHAKADRGQIRLRQISGQLPRRAEPRADGDVGALCAARFPEGADDRQHVRLGHRLQCRQCRLPARHHERPGRPRRRSRLARADRRPAADLVRRRRQFDQRRGAHGLLLDQHRAATRRFTPRCRRRRRARSSISRCPAAARASGRRSASDWRRRSASAMPSSREAARWRSPTRLSGPARSRRSPARPSRRARCSTCAPTI